MSGRVMRNFRRQANQVATKTVDAVAPSIQAAINNEAITRQRVDAMEKNLETLSDFAFKTEELAQKNANCLWMRSLSGRFRWLFLGR